ncbi:MAG TPA: hypothetical protein VF457_13830 [Burkholderiaceae bacterium]
MMVRLLLLLACFPLAGLLPVWVAVLAWRLARRRSRLSAVGAAVFMAVAGGIAWVLTGPPTDNDRRQMQIFFVCASASGAFLAWYAARGLGRLTRALYRGLQAFRGPPSAPGPEGPLDRLRLPQLRLRFLVAFALAVDFALAWRLRLMPGDPDAGAGFILVELMLVPPLLLLAPLVLRRGRLEWRHAGRGLLLGAAALLAPVALVLAHVAPLSPPDGTPPPPSGRPHRHGHRHRHERHPFLHGWSGPFLQGLIPD